MGAPLQNVFGTAPRRIGQDDILIRRNMLLGLAMADKRSALVFEYRPTANMIPVIVTVDEMRYRFVGKAVNSRFGSLGVLCIDGIDNNDALTGDIK